MKKEIKIINWVLIILLILQIILPILTNQEINVSHAQANIESFDITLTPNSDGYGAVTLDWSDYDYKDKVFKVYKLVDGAATYETVGIDYKLVKEVKCLQIYPTASSESQLRTWMETNQYGKGIIKIDTVSIDKFNANPDQYLKDANGDYKYGVIFFGTADANGSKGLSTLSQTATENFIKSGRGCIMGHDTLGYKMGGSLLKYFGIAKMSGQYSGNASNPYSVPSVTSYSTVKICKKGLLTNYPWDIGEVGTILTVPACHNMQSAANADIWLKFYLPSYSAGSMNSTSNFYLAMKNNCAMIQTGHSEGKATHDEQKILANLIFYCNQLISGNHITKDSSAQDFASPSKPIVSTKGLNLTWNATDKGTHYQYYVEGYDKKDTTETGLLARSVVKELTVTTGVKKYRYIMDQKDSTEITLKNKEEIETSNTSIPIDTNYAYLHVAAIDGAGNLGPTTHYAIPKTAKYTVNYYEMNQDGINYTLKKTDTKTADIGSKVEPEIEDYKGFTTPKTQSEIVKADDSLVINYYYTRNSSTLTINPNGGSWNHQTEEQSFTSPYHTTKNIPEPTRKGYTFLGWTRENTYGELSYTDPSSFIKDAIYTFGEINQVTDILIANWEANPYELEVKPNGGIWEGSTEDKKFTIDYEGKKEISIPIKKGYHFTKWILAGEGSHITEVKANKSTFTMGDEKATLTADWELILPSYTSQIKTTPVKGEKFVKGEGVQVVGIVTACSDNRNKVGLCKEEVSFTIDDGIKIDKNSIKINYIEQDGTTKQITKYTIDGNTIKAKFDSDKDSKITAGDSIRIEVKGTLEEVKDYSNTISYGGTLREYENGENTDIDLGIVTKTEGKIEDVVEKTNKIVIHLKDTETGKPIEGAVLQIIKKTEEDGKIKEEIIKEWTTGKEDKIYEGLPEGDYIIREVKLPENEQGYVKIEDKPIKMENDKEQEIELKQEHTKVTLEIIDEETNKKIDDVEIEVISKETGEVIKVKETEEGYIIEKVPEGDYIVRQKTPEGYQEVEDIEITIEGTGKTQIKTVENKKLVYDMQVEKELESIWVNGEKKTIRKGNMQKIEIKESKIETEDIKLEYVIRVSNVGEVKATIGNIIDNLPEGFKLVSTDWEQEGNQAIWDAKTEELNPGESKEVRIIVQWENDASNFGEKKNTAEIKESTNPYGYEDKNTDNNVGEEVTIFSIKTGSEEILTIIKIIDSILAACLVIYLIINKKIVSRNVKK